MAIELGRSPQAGGMTVVTVAVGATGQDLITVPTHMLDVPGYSAMLDAHVAKRENLIRLVGVGGDL